MQACNDEGMQMMRRVLLLGTMLMVPVLLAMAGTFLSAPSGPPNVDATPIELGPGPDGAPAHGMEPNPSMSPSAAPDTGGTPQPQPTEAPPVPVPPAAPVPTPPAEPVPVLPPVVIDDDDDEDDDGGEDDEQ